MQRDDFRCHCVVIIVNMPERPPLTVLQVAERLGVRDKLATFLYMYHSADGDSKEWYQSGCISLAYAILGRQVSRSRIKSFFEKNPIPETNPIIIEMREERRRTNERFRQEDELSDEFDKNPAPFESQLQPSDIGNVVGFGADRQIVRKDLESEQVLLQLRVTEKQTLQYLHVGEII